MNVLAMRDIVEVNANILFALEEMEILHWCVISLMEHVRVQILVIVIQDM